MKSVSDEKHRRLRSSKKGNDFLIVQNVSAVHFYHRQLEFYTKYMV